MAPFKKFTFKPKDYRLKEPFKKQSWCKHDTDDELDECPDHDSIATKPHKGK